MTDDYKGLFLRDYVGQTPSSGDPSGAWTASPDVFVSGAAPADSWPPYDEQPPNKVVVGQFNYVYVRWLNAGSSDAAGRIWLYAARSDLILWTENWESPFLVAGQSAPFQGGGDTAPGTVGATVLPFVWNVQPTEGGAHWALVAVAENPPLTEPPQSPVPPEAFQNLEDLANWVESNPNVGFLDTVAVPERVPTSQYVTPISGPPDTGNLSVGIQWQDLPLDGQIAFSVPGPDAAGTVVQPQTPIPTPTGVLLFPVAWPPGFQTSMTVSFWQGSTPLPSGATITPVSTAVDPDGKAPVSLTPLGPAWRPGSGDTGAT
jgi:hypothetical protein